MSFLSVLMMIILRMPVDIICLEAMTPMQLKTTKRQVRMKMKISLTWQKEYHDYRVDDWEPVDLHIAHGEVRVPARRPFHFTLLQWRTEPYLWDKQEHVKPRQYSWQRRDVSHLPVHRVGEEKAALFSRVDLLRDVGNHFRYCACVSLICFYI